MVCIKALRIFAAKISYNHLIFNIMSECKTVTLRTRPLKKGMLSFYLDYYPGYRDQETMKTIRHEGLNIYIYANPKNQRERDFNAAMSEKAEAIRCRRFEAIVTISSTNANTKRTFWSITGSSSANTTRNGDLSISTSTTSFTANALSKK